MIGSTWSSMKVCYGIITHTSNLYHTHVTPITHVTHVIPPYITHRSSHQEPQLPVGQRAQAHPLRVPPAAHRHPNPGHALIHSVIPCSKSMFCLFRLEYSWRIVVSIKLCESGKILLCVRLKNIFSNVIFTLVLCDVYITKRQFLTILKYFKLGLGFAISARVGPRSKISSVRKESSEWSQSFMR